MKRKLIKIMQIAILLFVFQITLPQLWAQPIPTTTGPIGSILNIGQNSEIKYWNGTAWIAIAPGLPGQSLLFVGGNPTWINNLQGVTTNPITSVSINAAISGGTIVSDGGALITAKGICWSTTSNPTLSDSITTDSAGMGNFTSNLSGLIGGTTYYVRAYASNIAGTAYGNQQSFVTFSALLPTLTTIIPTSINATSATSGGNILDNGGAPVTARGVCWSATTNPTVALSTKTTDSSGNGTFISSLTGLTPGTTYYARAYATNNSGSAYGNEFMFTTPANIPSISTTTITSITLNSAICGGNVTNTGGAAVTARGICWSITPNPTITDSKTINGTGTGTFSGSLTGLSANTTYYARAYATNNIGTAYGNELTFTTKVTDYDGNSYDAITIGSQVWMKQNLKTSHYLNGDLIPTVTDAAAWSTLTTGAYCYFNNLATNGTTYGKLYNWYAVMDSRKLCPTNWRVPSDNDYTILQNQLGGWDSCAVRLKESGTSHWTSPNTANNSSGFTALPGGFNYYGTFYDMGAIGYFWTSTDYSSFEAYRIQIYQEDFYNSSFDKVTGGSVRCVKGLSATLTTSAVSGITQNGASCGGNITADGGLPVSERGICWSTTVNPTIANNHTTENNGLGSFTANISGLINNTTYFVRAYATNGAGTVYGNEVSFTTLLSQFTDIDGNGYDTIHIGNQIWMKQNLKTNHFRNGDSIANVTANTTWQSLTSSAYCNYENNAAYVSTYGRLYNWYSTVDTRNLCPTNWHVPSDAEWTTLTTYLGGESVAGSKLKEIDFINVYGGWRYSSGSFMSLNDASYWWSTDEYSTTRALRRRMFTSYTYVEKANSDKPNGYSVRCIKD